MLSFKSVSNVDLVDFAKQEDAVVIIKLSSYWLDSQPSWHELGLPIIDSGLSYQYDRNGQWSLGGYSFAAAAKRVKRGESFGFLRRLL